MMLMTIISSVVFLKLFPEVNGLSIEIATDKDAGDASVTEMTGGMFTGVNTQKEATRGRETVKVTSNTYSISDRTAGVLHNEATSQSPKFENVSESQFLSTGVNLKKLNNNESIIIMVVNETLFQNTRVNNHENITETQFEKHSLATEIPLTTSSPDDKKQKNILSSEILHSNSPYHVQSEADRIHRFSSDRDNKPLQHHLHLVPMEDEPLGTMMMKDQQILISVLVPIGIGMIGTAMIVGTVCTLRYVARKRSVHFPLDNGIETEGPSTPCISSISAETTDKIFLLLDDEI